MPVAMVLIYLVAAYFAEWWPFRPDPWMLYIYPNKNNLSRFVSDGPFRSLDECRAGVRAWQADNRRYDQNFDYECGRACKFEAKYSMTVCKETAD